VHSSPLTQLQSAFGKVEIPSRGLMFPQEPIYRWKQTLSLSRKIVLHAQARGKPMRYKVMETVILKLIPPQRKHKATVL
jgi:hypothetical protein